MPKAASGQEVQTVFSIILAADGTTQVDSQPVENDDAVTALSKESRAKNPELRAVIKADAAVPHGRVIHVLDLLKQAGVSKIRVRRVPDSADDPGAEVELAAVAGLDHKNGMAVARPMTLSPDREPLDRALKIGDHTGTAIVVALLVAFLLHGTATARTLMSSPELFNWARQVENRVTINLTETIDIETEKPKPPPPPEPPPEEEKAKTIEPPIQKDVPPPPPPEAAQAGKVLTQDPDPNAPVDFTGDGFVSGNGESYVGGTTQAGGKGTHPVYNPNGRATGVANGTGAPAPKVEVGPDRSRAASRAGSDEWRCDFPPEADSEQIDEAFVTLQVVVGADARPKKVTVLQDPGHGFGRMAYQCAQRESYNASYDHDGNAIEAETRPFRVHFVR